MAQQGPWRTASQDEALRREAQDVARMAVKAPRIDQAVAPAPQVASKVQEGLETPATQGFSATELIGNLPESFIKNAKAVLWDLPKEALGAAKKYITDPGQYARDLALVPRYLPEMKDAIKGDYVDYYGNFGRRVSEDPFRFLSDVAGVAAIGGGTAATVGTKAAQSARIASRSVAKAGLGLAKGGRAVSKLTYLDPVDASFGAVAKIAPVLTDSLGIGKYTALIRAGESTIDSAEEIAMQKLGDSIWFKNYTPEDKARITRSFVWGDVAENEILKRERPDLWAKREAIEKNVLDPDRKYWVEEEKIVKSADADQAERIGAIRYGRQEGIIPKEMSDHDAMEMVNGLIKNGKIQPKYVTIFSDKKKGTGDLFDVINDKMYHSGMISRAEQRAMRGEIPTDIDSIMAHQIRGSSGAKKAIKFTRFVTGLMNQKGELKSITKAMLDADPQLATKLSKAGYAPFVGPFWEKYFDTFGRAVNHIAEAVKAKGSSIATVADAAEDFKSISLKAEEAVVNPIQELWAPRHVVAYMNQKLNPTWADSFLGKTLRQALNLGGLLPYYKAIATVFNPRYYIANSVGNAALAFLYGIHPQALKYAHKLHDYVPDEISNIGLSPLFRHEQGLVMGTANRFAQFAQKIDNFFKRAIYINERVVAGVREGILKTGKDFFVAEDALKAHLLQIKNRPNDWVNNLAEITRGKEKIAQSAMFQAELNQQLAKHGEHYAIAAVKDGGEGKTVPDSVYSPPIVQKADTGDQYGYTQVNAYKPVGHLKADKVVRRLEDQVAVLNDLKHQDAIPPWSEDSLLSKAELDFLEAVAFSPEAKLKAIDRYISVKIKQIERIKAMPLVKRKAPLSGETVDDVVYSSPRPKSVTGEIYPDATKPVLTESQESLVKVSQEIDALQSSRELAVTEALDRIVQTNKLQSLSPLLAREAQMADKAIVTSNKFLGSYSRLSPFERKIVRQFIPFYTFTKAMTQLAFRLPFRMPARQFMYLNLWRMWNDVIGEDNPKSSWFRNLTHIAALADGSVLMVRDGSFNPFANVRMTGVSGVEVPGAWDLLGSHPIFRIILNGRGQLQAKPVSPGEKATRLDNGEVWEFTGSGFKRVVAQPSWKKALWQLFPQTQMVDAVFLNSVQTDKGFSLAPDPVLGPDGKPVFPLGWQERMLSVVIPATRVNVDQLKRRENMKYASLVRSYIDDMRRAPPAKREAIRQVLHQLRSDIDARYLQY